MGTFVALKVFNNDYVIDMGRWKFGIANYPRTNGQFFLNFLNAWG
jgi:hypothetical protein